MVGLYPYLQYLDLSDYTDSHSVILCYLISIDKLDSNEIILLFRLELITLRRLMITPGHRLIEFAGTGSA